MQELITTLRTERTMRGISQEELAREVGVVRQTIAYLEKGEYMPSLGLALRLAAFFGKPVEELFQLITRS